MEKTDSAVIKITINIRCLKLQTWTRSPTSLRSKYNTSTRMRSEPYDKLLYEIYT